TYVAPSEMTFSQSANEWCTKWMERELSENTIMLRLGHLDNHVLPVIGHLSMKKITTMMLLDLMENLKRVDGKDKELSISSKQEIHKLLVSIFSRAIDWKVLTTNPMDGVKMPVGAQKKDKQLNVYDEDEVDFLIKSLENELYHWKIFMLLSLATGMRRGEVLGLEWEHIDLEQKTVTVKQIIAKTRNGYEVKQPKFESFRTISLPDSIANELKAYKQHCLEERIKLQHKWVESDRDWLFYNEDGRHFGS